LDMQAPAQIGKYKVIERLGTGGMGDVFKVRDLDRGRVVALKVVREQQMEEDALARFEREGRTMTQLSHPNIISVLDSGRDGDMRFIVMEFISGVTLKEHLASSKDHRLSEKEALNFTRQIGQGLGHVHAQGIIHRDIKPSNILIAGDNHVKLTDFGIAKALALSTLTKTGDIVGTAAYMPPEQALGAGLDARSDLYALGCVLFEMVAGRRPFSGDNGARLIFSHINDTPCLPRRVALEISPALETVIFKLLAKDPDQRYQSADELVAALDQVESQTSPGEIAIQSVERRWAQLMIGRDEEMSRLRSRLDAILGGKGGLVFLVGEAGIGKSRLAQQLGAYAKARGVRVLGARGYHQGGRVPYQPWIDLIRAALKSVPATYLVQSVEDAVHYLVKLLPELVDVLEITPESASGPPGQQRAHLFDAVYRFILRLSQDNPLLLFLDDLQAFDGASVQLLDSIAQRVAPERILIVGAYRDGEVEEGTELAKLIVDMNRERSSETIPLNGLDAVQVAEMVRKTFGGQALPELEALVFEKSEGNPFFIEELLSGLLSEELITMGGEGWEVKELSPAHVPEGIRAILQEQLGRLSEPCRTVLSSAAVIGREFGFRNLEIITEMSEEELADLIDEALQEQIIVEVKVPGEETYCFDSALLRDVLYDEITPVRRHRRHLKVGRALEQLCAGRMDECVEALAHHFLEGKDISKAMEYAIMAGDKAAAVFAWRPARAHYELAMDLIAPGEIERRAAVLQKLANVTMPLNDYDAALDYAKSALSYYEELGDKLNVVNTHMVIQAIYGGGAWDGAREYHALEHLQQISNLLEGDPDSLEKGMVYQRSAHVYLHYGKPNQALIWAQRAVDLYNRLNIARGTALGTALTYTGQIEVGLTYSEGNWPGVRQLENVLISSVYGHELALTLALVRDVPRAKEWADRVYQQVVNSGDFFEGQLNRPLILIYTLLGDVNKAGSVVQVQEEVEGRTMLGCYFEDAAGIGFYYWRRGMWERAEAYLEQAIDTHESRKNIAAVGACSYVLGNIYLEQGDDAGAEKQLLRSLEICREGGNVLFELWVLPALVALNLRREEVEQAAALVDRGLELMKPDQNWYGLPALIHLAQGMVESAQEQWDEAEASYREALVVNQHYALPWDQAKTLHEWGLMCGRRGKRETAVEKVDQAQTLFEEVGAVKDAEKSASARESLELSGLARLRRRFRRG
jgi:tetratricopeptide (TPR) repeat protein/predicted Ser/Thr protein kinase